VRGPQLRNLFPTLLENSLQQSLTFWVSCEAQIQAFVLGEAEKRLAFVGVVGKHVVNS